MKKSTFCRAGAILGAALLLVGTASVLPVSADSMGYDFEDGTAMGWVADDTEFFEENLSTPTASTAQSHGGSYSLAYPLNLDIKSVEYGCINDAGLIEPDPPKDLSGYNGIKTYVYIPADAVIGSDPVYARIFMKTGGAWKWFESTVRQQVTLGEWNEISIDLSAADDDNDPATPGVPVTNINDVKTIGVHIDGAAEASGTTTLYIDDVIYVGAIGEVVVIVEPKTISVEISGWIDLGTVYEGEEKVGDTCLTITNTGATAETYSIRVVDPSDWTSSATAPGEDTYVLDAMLNTTKPDSASFVEANHALITVSQICTSVKFAGNQTGVSVPKEEDRSLWVKFRAPTSTSVTEQQKMRIVVTAQLAE